MEEVKAQRWLCDSPPDNIGCPKAVHVTGDIYAAMLVPNILRWLQSDFVSNYHPTVASCLAHANVTATRYGPAWLAAGTSFLSQR